MAFEQTDCGIPVESRYPLVVVMQQYQLQNAPECEAVDGILQFECLVSTPHRMVEGLADLGGKILVKKLLLSQGVFRQPLQNRLDELN